MKPEFTSVRAINKACQDACWGNLRGKNVYCQRVSEDGQKSLVRISRARYSQKENKLFVRSSGKWFPCKYADVVTQ